MTVLVFLIGKGFSMALRVIRPGDRAEKKKRPARTDVKLMNRKVQKRMLILMAIFAGFLVISIYLPMFTMYNLF